MALDINDFDLWLSPYNDSRMHGMFMYEMGIEKFP